MSTTAPAIDETWNSADLFADDGKFDEAKRTFRDTLAPAIEPFRGKIAESAANLVDALSAICRAQELLRRVQCYASLKSDVDTRSAKLQAMRQESQLLAAEFGQQISFVRPEILATDADTLESFLTLEPRLAAFAHYLRDLVRQRDRVLSSAEEKIVAETSLLRSEPASMYQTLADADLPRPDVVLADGSSVTLTPANFHKQRQTTHRPDRQAMFPAYFGAYAAFRRTLGQNLYAATKAHIFRSRVRGYRSCLHAALDSDNVPEQVYRTLIDQVRERLPVLHRYLRLRTRALGVKRLGYPDLYCPLVAATGRKYTIAEARAAVLDGMQPLGEEYGSILDSAFRSRWIDWHPTRGKRSGAYSNGWAYGVHPYVLMNFNEDHDTVMTLAHEMGHALHSFFSNRAQPFSTASYSIFVAEVASTFNETLLRRRMFERAETDDERLFLLTSHLDGLRGTLFRQTMFAEFELEIHERAERGEALTGDGLSEIYLRILRDYHGHDEGVMEIDEQYAVEWAAIPHFYYDFYVYQYATGIVAATSLADGVLEGREGAHARYLAFLSSGGSDYPLELLRAAGVDLERADAYRQTFDSIDRTLDSLEQALA